jgi:hypothetical protein
MTPCLLPGPSWAAFLGLSSREDTGGISTPRSEGWPEARTAHTTMFQHQASENPNICNLTPTFQVITVYIYQSLS